MSARSLQLLDEAISLAHQELEILQSDELEGLEECMARREELIRMAAEKRSEQGEVEPYRERLLTLSNLQKRITQKAALLRDRTREDMKGQRKTNRCVAGYAKVVSRRHESFYHRTS